MVITLIGCRGTGKTTIGAALAERLNLNFVDIDPEIERNAGLSISEIFKQHGEPYFRSLESSTLSSVLNNNQTVVSPGGGAILNASNRNAMRNAGPVVWLVAPVETIVERLSADPETLGRRPSLTGTDVISEITEVLAARTPLYEEAATMIISTENRTPSAIVDEIVQQLPAEITS
ncbi:shikimate kinase AroL [Planctomicrobium sp. SH527]|uniref:shikimate kinase AroL n=1 Tax=Planctomicrobium sp. SH527 TaxID=3448123 RepID=UPI003F5BF0F2